MDAQPSFWLCLLDSEAELSQAGRTGEVHGLRAEEDYFFLA